MDDQTSAPGARRRATIEDVAAAAGVSVATVSRALRGLPNVAFSTREHVQTVATSLSYHADPAASRLAAGRSRSIGIAVPLLSSWYFSQIIAGAEAVCAEEGYDVVVMGVTGAEARRRLLAENAAIHRRVDGLIVVDIPLSDDDEEMLSSRGLSVVTIGADTRRFAAVGIDDVEVGHLATRYLIELGHRRIALIAGQPEDPLGFQVPDLRRNGYLAAMREAGLDPDPALQVGGNFSLSGGREAMAALLSSADPPTGVFAMSDEMAFGALLAAKEAGLRVPDDLSLVGVDDHDLSVVVGLTTVRQRVADHGARAARLVVDALGGATIEPRRYPSPIELVERDTCAPPVRHVTA